MKAWFIRGYGGPEVLEQGTVPDPQVGPRDVLVDLGGVGPGHKVFVQAGAGGVGTLAIQIARHLGAHVATTASAPKHALLRELSANECIDYRSQDFTAVLRDYDFVLDSLGGKALADSFAILRPGGMVVSIAGVPDPAFARTMGLNPALRLAVRLMSWPTRRRAARHGAAYHYLFMRSSGEQLATLTGLVDQGALRLIVDRVFPFDAADQAVAYAETGHATGKVIVSREPG